MLSFKKYDINKNKINDGKIKKDNKIFNPFKNIKEEDNYNEEEDIGMCKLVLRKLIKDFTYERVLYKKKKKNKYLNSLLERPLDSLCKQYKIETIDKAMKELKEEMNKDKTKENIIK